LESPVAGCHDTGVGLHGLEPRVPITKHDIIIIAITFCEKMQKWKKDHRWDPDGAQT